MVVIVIIKMNYTLNEIIKKRRIYFRQAYLKMALKHPFAINDHMLWNLKHQCTKFCQFESFGFNIFICIESRNIHICNRERCHRLIKTSSEFYCPVSDYTFPVMDIVPFNYDNADYLSFNKQTYNYKNEIDCDLNDNNEDTYFYNNNNNYYYNNNYNNTNEIINKLIKKCEKTYIIENKNSRRLSIKRNSLPNINSDDNIMKRQKSENDFIISNSQPIIISPLLSPSTTITITPIMTPYQSPIKFDDNNNNNNISTNIKIFKRTPKQKTNSQLTNECLSLMQQIFRLSNPKFQSNNELYELVNECLSLWNQLLHTNKYKKKQNAYRFKYHVIIFCMHAKTGMFYDNKNNYIIKQSKIAEQFFPSLLLLKTISIDPKRITPINRILRDCIYELNHSFSYSYSSSPLPPPPHSSSS